MARAEYNADEWVDFSEPTAPISMSDLMATGGIAAITTEQRRDWCAKSISAWQLVDAYGIAIDEPPSGNAIMRLDYAHIKWLFGEAVKATVELPLLSSRPSPNGSTPAAVTA